MLFSRLRPFDLLLAGALASGVLIAFADPLTGMVRQWNESPMYSYAFTVPLISAFMVWHRRNIFARESMAPARLPGTVILVAALSMLIVGEAAAIQVVQQGGFIVAIAGIVLVLFGWRFLKVSLPAIAYLLFMVPIWDVFTEPLHWRFQVNSARLGVAMLQTFGVPVYREDTVLVLPNLVIEVARACSGVNYLVAVLALALPLSFTRLQSGWRRGALIAAAMGIAACANSLRVALICVLAYYDVGSPLHGPFHVLHGLFVAGVGYVVLFAGLGILERGESVNVPRESSPRPIGTWRTPDVVAVTGIFWAIALLPIAPHAAPVSLTQPLDALAGRMGQWYPDPIMIASATPTDAWAKADHRFSRRFRTAQGREAIVDVWHFEAQHQHREVVNFQAADLHRRATTRQVNTTLLRPLEVNFVAWPEKNEIGVFWYDIAGIAAAHQYVAKARSVWNVIRSGRNDAAVVMLRSPGGLDDAAALSALDDLAAQVAPALGRLWRPAVR